MNPEDLVPLLTAANAGTWLVFTALLVGLIVRLVKVNPTIAAKISPRIRPWLAVALGLVGGVANKIVEGTAWKTALLGGALAGLTAILGHQFVIESALGGKEIGLKPPKDDNGTTGGGGTPYRDPAPPSEPTVVVDEPKNDPLREVLSRLHARAWFARQLFAIAFTRSNVQRSLGAVGILLAVGAFAMVEGCALFTSKNANTALDAVQLACVFESAVTDEQAVADACGIAKDLTPILRKLVGQREAAKRAGVVWHSSDAGADAGAEAGR